MTKRRNLYGIDCFTGSEREIVEIKYEYYAQSGEGEGPDLILRTGSYFEKGDHMIPRHLAFRSEVIAVLSEKNVPEIERRTKAENVWYEVWAKVERGEYW